jgi:nitroimidazol reductase NimA-like FMN-containing flavoprotein (pyridoxamine 5'-phosphate oxidase superfamily)
MSDQPTVDLDAAERDGFLGRGGVGVISFATDEGAPPHTIPVSYGYDAEQTAFYFRLAVGESHAKTAVVDRPVTFVVYGEDDDRWESVIATGHLEQTDSEGIETETLDGLDRVHIPLVDIFGEPSRAVTFEFVRLVPEELTGRKESSAGV